MSRPRPLIVHAPSNPALKGTAEVERVLGPMAGRGLIELRMVTGMPPAEAAALIRSADVVVDQLLLGLYGVLACEAMACGRVVLGHLGESLRARVASELAEEVPVIETNPRTLGEVVQRLLDEPDWARKAASAGPDFVRRVHDGRRSAAVLAPFLGVAAPQLDGPPAP
jgi:glycosyltransferase involved in cell wall biosynthesis